MRVLVTGTSGLLGGRVASALAARGDDVTVLQRRASGLGLREVRGDIRDPATLERAVQGQDGVVHLAAKVNVVGRWPDYASINVEGTRNVVQACLREGVQRLVQVSSPSVAHVGRSLVGVGAEPADPAGAHGNYARSKAMSERLALAADGEQLQVVAVRPHLVWGPGDTQLVGRIIDRARSGRLALVGSGAALIDTTYVDNAADATVAALDRCPEVHGRAFVVTNGEPRPVAEMVASICHAAGVPLPRAHVPYPLAWTAGGAAEGVWGLGRLPGEPPLTRFLARQLGTAHWFDQRTTRAALRWQPRVSLEEGFEELARHGRVAPVLA